MMTPNLLQQRERATERCAERGRCGAERHEHQAEAEYGKRSMQRRVQGRVQSSGLSPFSGRSSSVIPVMNVT